MSVDEATASPDATCARFLDALRAELGDKVLGSAINGSDLIVRVDRSVWVQALRTCRTKLGLDYFCFLSGLDWLDSPLQTTRYENVWGSVEEEAAEGEAEEPAEPAPTGLQTGLAGGDTRFQVFARLSSLTEHRSIVLKADLDDEEPSVESAVGVFAGANWHERETAEMYGFTFEGHPHPVHIYLPGAFEGYPLRKDFPLLAREVKPWPGLTNVEPIAGEAEGEEGGES